MDNKKDTIETLDFDDTVSFEKTDVLDFEDVSDKKVSDEIDNMLDFTIHKDPSSLNELLTSGKDEDKKIEINASNEVLDEYKPSIRDFNIKSAKVRKIVYKSMLYVVIVMLVGFEFFLNKSGDALRDLRVYASDNQPIKIVQNGKYGYIDKVGNILVNPKYNYADDFIKGYAIVKNASNLPLIINKGGKEVVPSGTYFTIYRAGESIVVSKATKAGLRYGILDANLKVKTNFDYDSIYYAGNLFTYAKENEVGILNNDGNEIFNYKLTDSDNKVIEVKESKVTSDDTSYAIVKVSGTTQIINTKTGKVASNPTLNKVEVEDNNVFYELSGDQKKYMYVKDDKLLLDSGGYKNVSVSSIKSGVIKAINNKGFYEFISTNTMEQLKKDLSLDNTFFGDEIFVYKDRNYVKNINNFIFIKEGKQVGKIEGDFEFYKPFKNGVAIVKFPDDTFGYVNSDAKFINDEHYLEAQEFDSYGDAIAKKESGYGVIGKDGKTKISFENKEIKMINGDLKNSLKSLNNNVFYAIKNNDKYVLYNSKLKKRDDNFYNDIVFDEKYPIFKAATDTIDAIMSSDKLSSITLTSFNADYEAYDTYIKIKNEYYNYNGKLIYTDKSGGE